MPAGQKTNWSFLNKFIYIPARTYCIFVCVFFFLQANAQKNVYTGTWEMYKSDSASLHIRLQIANPEKNTLYPAQLKITYGNFSGAYELLLVKKNDGSLAIGRNKIPVQETPFSIGAWTVMLNGVFQYKKHRGYETLQAERIPTNKYGVTMPSLLNYTDAFRHLAMQLRDSLKEAPLVLNKINSEPWKSESVDKILYPWMSGVYYGIMDSIQVRSAHGILHFTDNNRVDNDTVSVTLNGKTILDKIDVSKQNPTAEIQLDTGMNLLCFYADNYGHVPPNTAKLNLAFEQDQFAINFANKADISATFIVAKIYYYPQKKENNWQTTRNPPPPKNIKITDRALERETKLVDSIKLNSAQITLAIWDDAVEDGDSISLSINDQWIVQGFAVKKKPQFLTVTLEPGINNIIFVADNLGAIPPNTSLLEIIDGKFRKAYYINTNLSQNNQVKIRYDYKGP